MDFFILFLSQFLAFTLALNAVLFMLLHYAPLMLKKIINNDLQHMYFNVVDKEFNKNRAAKGADTKAAKKEQKIEVGSEFEQIVGPEIASLVENLPEDLKNKIKEGAVKNPALAKMAISKVLDSRSGGGSRPGGGAGGYDQGQIEFVE